MTNPNPETPAAADPVPTPAGASRAWSLNELRSAVERQHLVLTGLLRALCEKGVTTEEELNRLAREVDLADGRADGRLREQGGPVICPKCGRKTSTRRAACIWCQAPIEAGYFRAADSE